MAIYGPGGGGSSGGDVTGGSASSTGELAAYSDTSGKAIGRSFAILSGPATSAKTYTLPNTNSTLVVGSTGATDNAIIRAEGAGSATIQSSAAKILDNGQLQFAAGTEAAPGISMAAYNSGFYDIFGNGNLGITVNGNSRGYISGNGLALQGSYMTITDANAFILGASGDTTLSRQAAGVFQLGTNANNALGSLLAVGATLSSATVPLTFSNAAFQGCTALSTSAGGVLVCTVSDVRLKDVIGPSGEGLDAILAITPQKFTWKDGRREGVQSGLIAQDVQAALPMGVSETGGGYLQLEKDAIIGALINAVKELYATVEDLRGQVLALSAPKG